MASLRRVGLICGLVLTGVLLAWGALLAAGEARAAPASTAAAATPTQLPNKPAVESPNISFIDSPSASCVLPERHTGKCYLSWSYLYATADPNYMISMTVEIDGRMRGRYNGFFQTNMYVPAEMLVFRVACGAPGSGGNPKLGMSHSYILRGRDSANLGSANYGSVNCPADEPYRVFVPLQRR